MKRASLEGAGIQNFAGTQDLGREVLVVAKAPAIWCTAGQKPRNHQNGQRPPQAGISGPSANKAKSEAKQKNTKKVTKKQKATKRLPKRLPKKATKKRLQKKQQKNDQPLLAAFSLRAFGSRSSAQRTYVRRDRDLGGLPWTAVYPGKRGDGFLWVSPVFTIQAASGCLKRNKGSTCDCRKSSVQLRRRANLGAPPAPLAHAPAEAVLVANCHGSFKGVMLT